MKTSAQKYSAPHDARALENFVGALVCVLVFFLLTRPAADPDLWWHLRAGEYQWQHHAILLFDVFSFTRHGAAWINAFWLSDLLLYLLQRAGGAFSVSAFVAAMGSLTFYLIYRRMSGRALLNAAVLVLAALTAAPEWSARPQLISFFLLALLDDMLARGRPRWLILPLFAVWSNLHGGWIWGILLLIAHAAGLFATARRDSIRLFGWTALAALAVVLNPNGLKIWTLPFQQVNVSLQIQEWLSPDFHRLDFHPLLWMLFLLIASAPYGARPLDLGQLLKMLGFAYLTFLAQRHIALFAIVAAPLLADQLNGAANAIRPRARARGPDPVTARLPRSLVNGLIIFALAAAALARLLTDSRPQIVERDYPEAALNWLQANHPPGNLFNSYNWGGYVLWKLPAYPVFIDGRADLYGRELIAQWQDVVAAHAGALDILDRWNVRVVLIEPRWPIVEFLKSNGWDVAYQDALAVVLVRK